MSDPKKPLWERALHKVLLGARRKANVFGAAENASPLEEPNRWASSLTQYARPSGDILDSDMVLDAVPQMATWTAERGRDEIKAAELRGVGAATRTRDFGGRTFPTATMINGTPMGTDAAGVIARVARRKAEMRASFQESPTMIKDEIYEDEVKSLTSPRPGIIPLEKSSAYTDPSSPVHPLSGTAMLKEQKRKAASAWKIMKERAGGVTDVPLQMAVQALKK